MQWRLLLLLLLLLLMPPLMCSPPHSRESTRLARLQKVEAMFYHAYNNYMRHAFPMDDLRPLSCDGANSYYHQALTLIDSLDMLALLGNISEFERQVNWVSANLKPLQGRNQSASVFEVTIRVVGGLLSAHLLAGELLPSYTGALLGLTTQVADGLLVAFDTPSKIPINTFTAAPGGKLAGDPHNTPAGAFLLLELGMLSFLTEDCRYLQAAARAEEALWQARSDIPLLSSVIDVRTGQWVDASAQLGGGVDSFYEYLLKSYVLFGDETQLARWEQLRNSLDQVRVHQGGA